MVRKMLTGNAAAAWGARLADVDYVPAFPITPQTECIEQLCKEEIERGSVVRVESEHSAMAVCIGFALGGARTFTATSSQGLLLMHELLHYASGARAPIVMANVNRTLASPWAFWPDQTDSLAQRDTALGRLARDVHLQQHVERRHAFRALFRQPPRDSLPVNAVHPLEALGHRARLVALERPDQVPFGTAYGVHLLLGFLHIVLAESALPGGQRLLDQGRRMGLRHRQQSHPGGGAAGRLRGTRDALTHGLQVFMD